MAASTARITAELAEPITTIPPELIDLINKNVKPPAPVTQDEVSVRTMLIVSDQVTSFGGRFPVEEHPRLVSLLVDSPVMVGHRKDKLPVARTFHAATMRRGNEHWVKSYFYWLKSARGADDLRENIDGGIYKECSLAFTYHLPECSICGRDIRRCQHEPLREYDREGNRVTCHYNFRRIDRVLETSLVYRGALPDTAVSRELGGKGDSREIGAAVLDDNRLTLIDDLCALDPTCRYLVTPRYDGIPVALTRQDNAITLSRLDGTVIDHSDAVQLGQNVDIETACDCGLLIGYRGKERCHVQELEKYLGATDGSVSRLALMLYPPTSPIVSPVTPKPSTRDLRLIPHRFAAHEELHRRALEIKTRDGVEIWPLNSPLLESQGYIYRPTQPQPMALSPRPEECLLTFNPKTRNGRLIVTSPNLSAAFEIKRLDYDRLRAGARFVARQEDARTLPDGPPGELLARNRLANLIAKSDSMTLVTGDKSEECWVLRPILLRGERGHLFYILKDYS